MASLSEPFKEDGITRQVMAIRSTLALVEKVETVEELMGVEGTAARHHFEALRLILKQDMGFKGRVRRPPTDPVNAMLSFGYTLLFNRMQSAVEQLGLDPLIGNLHRPEDRRASLALDLMEELRVLLVDSVVSGMVNRLEVVPGDFFKVPDKGVRMTEPTIAKLVKSFPNRD